MGGVGGGSGDTADSGVNRGVVGNEDVVDGGTRACARAMAGTNGIKRNKKTRGRKREIEESDQHQKQSSRIP